MKDNKEMMIEKLEERLETQGFMYADGSEAEAASQCTQDCGSCQNSSCLNL